MLEPLLEQFRQRGRLALSRLLSLLARGEHAADILARLEPPAQPAFVAALTGSAGAGKSTLIGRLLETMRAGGQTVAVLACDPESPLSGGALLGDRFRMSSHPDDDGVFIRSLAAVGGRGALADHLGDMIRLLECYGFDVILVETVGAGQGDTAVRELADAVVVLLQPETGDDLQWEKAGVLEVADVLVLHKADLPGADQTEAQVKSMLSLGGHSPPIVRVSSRTGEGVAELWETMRACPRRRRTNVGGDDLIRLAQQQLQTRYAQSAADPAVQAIVEGWRSGKATAAEAAAELLRLLLGEMQEKEGEPGA